MPKLRFRMRHVFIGILGVAVLISTFGSLLETLDFNDIDKPRPVSSPAKARAWIEDFHLDTPSEADTTLSPQDGAAIEVVHGRDINLSARVEGVRDLIVVAARGERDTAASTTAKPEANGEVSVSLRLPQANTVYVIQAYGIVKEKLIPGWQGGSYDNRPAVSFDAPIRVIVK